MSMTTSIFLTDTQSIMDHSVRPPSIGPAKKVVKKPETPKTLKKLKSEMNKGALPQKKSKVGPKKL